VDSRLTADTFETENSAIRGINFRDKKGAPALRIALVGIGLNSYTNPNVAAALRSAFPECLVDWIDLRALLGRQKLGLVPVLSAAHAIGEFSREMGARLWQVAWRRGWTRYLFQERSRVAAEMVARRRYLFSMQIQTTFDASVPDVPHFVYTDNTMLANLQYKGSTRSDVPVTEEWLALERQTYHNAWTSFVMSRNVGRSIVEDYGCVSDKVVCAYGGPNAPIEEVGEKKYDQKNILFVGVDWDRKGGPELVEAFRLVRRRIPDATLTIVGCSPAVHEPGCLVVGRIPPAELARYYTNASVFCLPSRNEPFGIVFIEAMAHRMPVVATDIAAIPDFVTNGENGFLVSPGDTQALAEALVRVLGDPELCGRMGERSYAASKKYTWGNTGSIMRSTIEQFVRVG
jgi:glycosyltransferase involved in cell wall biosynthesis